MPNRSPSERRRKRVPDRRDSHPAPEGRRKISARSAFPGLKVAPPDRIRAADAGRGVSRSLRNAYCGAFRATRTGPVR